jgi:hypothetical protein
MKDQKMQKPSSIPKAKQAPFNKEAFLKAAEKVKKVFEKEEKERHAPQNA